MLKRFDHIIKSALEDFIAPHVSDWDVFYDLLQAEQDAPLSEDEKEELDRGDMLRDLEYTGSMPAWGAFEHQLDELNTELDAEFDRTVGDALEKVSPTSWGAGNWQMFSPMVDELNTELDKQFDQSINSALVNIPEASWKESHWQMLSSRLDQLNDRPRLLLMKVIEAAAILLILVQLTNLYSDYQRNNDVDNPLAGIIEQLFRSDGAPDVNDRDIIVQPNSFPQPGEMDNDRLVSNPPLTGTDDSEGSEVTDLRVSANTQENATVNISGQDSDIAIADSDNLFHGTLTHLPRDGRDFIKYNYHDNLGDLQSGNKDYRKNLALPSLTTDPSLISYDDTPSRLLNPAARLDVGDISLLTANSSDSILHSIPTFQVIKPRLYSSLEVGMLADATNVEIQDFLAVSQEAYQVPTLNAGLYFRYKIQYQDMFGSLGGDFLRMKYDGLSNENELAMVTLPLELGVNVVNLPTLRMYFSGGVAGRFVPVANYSPDPYNQASDYNRESNKQTNGLFNNGPFEINSYLSGRLSMGLDINVNMKTSINLRFSHDFWLKGRGIGYNLDRFRSSHLAIGANHHF